MFILYGFYLQLVTRIGITCQQKVLFCRCSWISRWMDLVGSGGLSLSLDLFRKDSSPPNVISKNNFCKINAQNLICGGYRIYSFVMGHEITKPHFTSAQLHSLWTFSISTISETLDPPPPVTYFSPENVYVSSWISSANRRGEGAGGLVSSQSLSFYQQVSGQWWAQREFKFSHLWVLICRTDFILGKLVLVD